MEKYDLVSALRPLRAWVNDLSTWWLRRSRERMKGDSGYDRTDALRTLREALLETSALLAPFAPFFAERLYQDLSGPKMSVHLDRWPKADERVIDTQLLADMQLMRDLATAAHEARATSKMPVRQALASLRVSFRDAADASRLSQRTEFISVLRDEINVEQVLFQQGNVETEDASWQIVLDIVLTPDLKKKGMVREFSRHVMNLRKALGLTPQDHIALAVGVSEIGMRETLENLMPLVAPLVQADDILVGESLGLETSLQETIQLDGHTVELGIQRIIG